ncbi:MAG: hypothetical protein IJ838_05120 [Paludibacteraceae bacterium]|nr:hypothetical protein [Paludibacteraceae bacterium]
MKYAIRYFSKFGHSEQMAQVIAQVVNNNAETVATPLSEKVDILFLGAGIFLGSVNKAVMQFIDTLTAEQVGCVVLFGSSALIGEPTKGMRQALMKRGVKVYEQAFECKGAMGPVHSGHPDKNDLDNLRAFTEQVIKDL